MKNNLLEYEKNWVDFEALRSFLKISGRRYKENNHNPCIRHLIASAQQGMENKKQANIFNNLRYIFNRYNKYSLAIFL